LSGFLIVQESVFLHVFAVLVPVPVPISQAEGSTDEVDEAEVLDNNEELEGGVGVFVGSGPLVLVEFHEPDVVGKTVELESALLDLDGVELRLLLVLDWLEIGSESVPVRERELEELGLEDPLAEGPAVFDVLSVMDPVFGGSTLLEDDLSEGFSDGLSDGLSEDLGALVDEAGLLVLGGVFDALGVDLGFFVIGLAVAAGAEDRLGLGVLLAGFGVLLLGGLVLLFGGWRFPPLPSPDASAFSGPNA